MIQENLKCMAELRQIELFSGAWQVMVRNPPSDQSRHTMESILYFLLCHILSEKRGQLAMKQLSTSSGLSSEHPIRKDLLST